MRTASSLLASVALLAFVHVVPAQTPSPAPVTTVPAASPEPSATPARSHRHKKATDPAASPTPAASPAEAGASGAGTAAPSPEPSATPAKSHRKKKEAVEAPAASPAASPEAAGAPPAGVPPPAAGSPPATAGATPGSPTHAKQGPPKFDPNTPPAPGGGPGLVWVNTKSHVYHQQSSRYYGKTKAGKYMSEKDALAEGDHAAPHNE